MEVHFRPDVQAKLDQMARESGRPSDELVEDAVVGYFDELAHARETLDRRFDDLECGRVTPIDGEEAYRLLMERTESQRRRSVGAGMRFTRKHLRPRERPRTHGEGQPGRRRPGDNGNLRWDSRAGGIPLSGLSAAESHFAATSV